MNLTSALRFFWAHWTPSQADWLKLLSSTLPTSVTRPTRRVLAPAAAGAVVAAAAGAVVGFAAGAAVGAAGAAVGAAVGAGVVPPWQAVSTTASALSSAATRREVDMSVPPGEPRIHRTPGRRIVRH